MYVYGEVHYLLTIVELKGLFDMHGGQICKAIVARQGNEGATARHRGDGQGNARCLYKESKLMISMLIIQRTAQLTRNWTRL